MNKVIAKFNDLEYHFYLQESILIYQVYWFKKYHNRVSWALIAKVDKR